MPCSARECDPGRSSVPRPIGKRALLLPLAFVAGLAAFGFLAAAGALFAWWLALLVLVHRSGRILTFEVVLKKQHYLQACVQSSLLLYWGWYWPPVYAFLPFILAQLVFAYAFDI